MNRESIDPETGEVNDSLDFSGPVEQRGRVRTTIARYAEKLRRKRQLPTGEEIPDPVPLAPPLGFIEQPSMIDHVRNMIRSEQLRQAALASGDETFEEADDFDIPDDVEPYSAYEMEEIFDPVRPASEPAPIVTPDPPADGPVPSPASAPAPIAS